MPELLLLFSRHVEAKIPLNIVACFKKVPPRVSEHYRLSKKPNFGSDSFE